MLDTTVDVGIDTRAWSLLKFQTTPQEFKIALVIANRLEVKLDYDTINTEISRELGIDKNIVNKALLRLFKLGVLAEIEVAEVNDRVSQIKHYWVFNDYLALNYNDYSTPSLFEDTYYAKVMR